MLHWFTKLKEQANQTLWYFQSHQIFFSYLDGNIRSEDLEVVIISPGLLGLLHNGHRGYLHVAVLHQLGQVVARCHQDAYSFH